jgi:hypothetical protein
LSPADSNRGRATNDPAHLLNDRVGRQPPIVLAVLVEECAPGSLAEHRAGLLHRRRQIVAQAEADELLGERGLRQRDQFLPEMLSVGPALAVQVQDAGVAMRNDMALVPSRDLRQSGIGIIVAGRVPRRLSARN